MEANACAISMQVAVWCCLKVMAGQRSIHAVACLYCWEPLRVFHISGHEGCHS